MDKAQVHARSWLADAMQRGVMHASDTLAARPVGLVGQSAVHGLLCLAHGALSDSAIKQIHRETVLFALRACSYQATHTVCAACIHAETMCT